MSQNAQIVTAEEVDHFFDANREPGQITLARLLQNPSTYAQKQLYENCLGSKGKDTARKSKAGRGDPPVEDEAMDEDLQGSGDEHTDSTIRSKASSSKAGTSKVAKSTTQRKKAPAQTKAPPRGKKASQVFDVESSNEDDEDSNDGAAEEPDRPPPPTKKAKAGGAPKRNVKAANKAKDEDDDEDYDDEGTNDGSVEDEAPPPAKKPRAPKGQAARTQSQRTPKKNAKLANKGKEQEDDGQEEESMDSNNEEESARPPAKKARAPRGPRKNAKTANKGNQEQDDTIEEIDLCVPEDSRKEIAMRIFTGYWLCHTQWDNGEWHIGIRRSFMNNGKQWMKLPVPALNALEKAIPMLKKRLGY